jgi:general stress protein 26
MAGAVDPRSRIRLTPAECDAYLEQERTVVCATVGKSGAPHLVPLWYVLRPSGPEGALEIWSWTFAKAQKARNLERDSRATLLVEDGLVYHELRGVMLETTAIAHPDLESVRGLGLELARRYQGGGREIPDDARAGVEAQAAKRVAFQFVEQRRVSWDHRKLLAR